MVNRASRAFYLNGPLKSRLIGKANSDEPIVGPRRELKRHEKTTLRLHEDDISWPCGVVNKHTNIYGVLTQMD